MTTPTKSEDVGARLLKTRLRQLLLKWDSKLSHEHRWLPDGGHDPRPADEHLADLIIDFYSPLIEEARMDGNVEGAEYMEELLKGKV